MFVPKTSTLAQVWNSGTVIVMDNLPLWKRCRIVANPLRLRLLAHLLESPRQYVKAVAGELELTEDVASKNLQLLASGGFLKCESVSKYLYYTLAESDDLLTALLWELKNQSALDPIIHMLTALTHERRVLLVALLSKTSMDVNSLCCQMKMSGSAAKRHLDKLARRGWVEVDGDVCTLCFPSNPLGRAMIELVKNDSTLAQVWQKGEQGL